MEQILENYFDKDLLADILSEYNMPTGGKKSVLIELVLRNTTILEHAIKDLLKETYKDQLEDIADDLGIDSDSTVSELKLKIMEHVHKATEDKSMQKKIDVLDACFDKDEILEIIEAFNMTKAGKKLKLLESIARNQSMMEFAMKEWQSNAYKEDLEALCEKLGIDSEGNKAELEDRIQDYLTKRETKAKVASASSENYVQKKSTHPKTKGEISEEDLENNFENFDPYEMEALVGKLFEKKGYESEITRKSGDFGIDVWAKNLNEKIGIQVKHQEHDVGYDAIAKTVGSVITQANKIIIVSTKSGFSKQCYEYQIDHQHFVQLWNSKKLKEEIRRYLF